MLAGRNEFLFWCCIDGYESLALYVQQTWFAFSEFVLYFDLPEMRLGDRI